MICADDDAVWQALTVRRAQEFESLKPFLEQWIDAARGFATRCDDPKQKPTVKLAVSKMLLLRPNLQALAVAYQVGDVGKLQDGKTIEDAGIKLDAGQSTNAMYFALQYTCIKAAGLAFTDTVSGVEFTIKGETFFPAGDGGNTGKLKRLQVRSRDEPAGPPPHEITPPPFFSQVNDCDMVWRSPSTDAVNWAKPLKMLSDAVDVALHDSNPHKVAQAIATLQAIPEDTKQIYTKIDYQAITDIVAHANARVIPQQSQVNITLHAHTGTHCDACKSTPARTHS